MAFVTVCKALAKTHGQLGHHQDAEALEDKA
jgi:hypothetical protein